MSRRPADNLATLDTFEFILMERKGGGYRKPDKPDLSARILSLLSETSFKRLFQQIWTDIPGVSTRDHPAPFPVTLAERLIRMFSFVGDTVLDPFNGTATTQVAAAACGRNSIGIEVDPGYFADGLDRLRRETSSLLSTAQVSQPFDAFFDTLIEQVSTRNPNAVQRAY